MDLILKPTLKCNFKCTFCSSTTIADDANVVMDLDLVRRFVIRYPDTKTIIINGGDPLMMPPKYYWDLIDILDELDSKASISFTTNLWPFYKAPHKWAKLFNHWRVGVGTSFQFGNSRLKGDYTPYTVDDFWAVSNAMLEHVGERPTFIAVIDHDIVHTVLDTVRLARDMGVVCKVNHLMGSGGIVDTGKILMGSHNRMFTKGDICKTYVDIWRAGLMEWEHNTQEMAKVIRGGHTICPLSRNCDSGIRTLQPEGDYYSCGAFGDDREYPIDFEHEMAGGFVTPLQVPELASMKNGCYDCPMFSVCNGCKKTIADTKRLGLVEHHCRIMKSIAHDIIEMNGLTGALVPTPYVDESVVLIARG